MELNFEEDVKINKFKLADEAEKQPSLYHRYTEVLAEAEKEKDESKRQLELTEAQVYLEKKQIKIDGKAPTEAMLKSLVIDDDRYQDAKKDYLEKSHKVNVIKAGVSSLEQRNSQLKVLASLLIAGFYSAPTDSAEVKQLKDAERKHRNTLNKKKRGE